MDLRRNRLGETRSPYLLQHKDNPVWWQPWDEQALAEARRRDVPVFLSIGYSTCHWCHVMEHESFEDDGVARVLNEHFVPIKVDREERPDLDAIYMDAVQALTQHGGWPLSAFLAPDGRPFFGGTYFPRPQFLQLLEQVRRAWTEDRARIDEAGAELGAALERAARRGRAGRLDASLLLDFADRWEALYDRRHGGRQGAPKFPPAYDMQLLLRIARRSGEPAPRQIVRGTLDAMARGGICDHLGGGFHRYATDERWLVPHFEKMLYDQASLAQAFLDGWLATGHADDALVVRETLDYVLRDLRHPDGGLFSAEDADSEGEEGRFYVWTMAELHGVLGSSGVDALREAFDVSDRGNFEHGTNILALRAGVQRAGRSPELSAAMRTLLEVRGRRVRPHRDDKVLTDWNGLAIAALARAGRALPEPRYVAAAQDAAAFLLAALRAPDGRLLHRWRDGDAGIPAFLDDHAFLVHALIELYQADFDPRWLAEAGRLQDEQDRLFRDAATGDYWVTDGRDPSVIQRRVDPWDNVTPAGRSVTALNLLRLGALFVEPELGERAAQIFESTPGIVRRAPEAFSVLLAALDMALDESPEVAIAGAPDDARTAAAVATLARAYQPNMVLAAGTGGVPLLDGRRAMDELPVIYVCRQGSCSLPRTDPSEALAAATRFAPLERPE